MSRKETSKRIREEFINSYFYKKYKDSYFSDSILKDVFGERLYKKRFHAKVYEDVFNKNIEVIRDLLLYVNSSSLLDDKTKYLMLKSVYIDPDCYSKKEVNGVICTADGLISISRLYSLYGSTEEMLKEYIKYRAQPIFHFPKEKKGINISRANAFGDRIDHTLFDIKRFCEGADNCRLKSTFDLPKTNAWLSGLGNDFHRIVDFWEVKGIFVNDNYEVFDLEKDDGSVISKYNDLYDWEWSDEYYTSLKKKIEEYKKSSI